VYLQYLFLGFMKAQLTMENGRRWSTDKILYQRPNHALTILTHSRATKVSLSKSFLACVVIINVLFYLIILLKILVNLDKAEGIEFARFGNKYTAIAKKGVILSAGTIESPKLLMLSGIGPKKHLEKFGVSNI